MNAPKYTHDHLRAAIERSLAAVPFTFVGDVKYTHDVYNALHTAMPDCTAEVRFNITTVPRDRPTRELVVELVHGSLVQRVPLTMP